MVPPCQCSRTRPVVRMKGYSSSASSITGMNSSGVNLPRPRGKDSVNSVGVPGWFMSQTGYCSPTSSMRSYVTPAKSGTTPAISANTSAGLS